MMALLEFIFRDLYHFWGSVLLILILVVPLYNCVGNVLITWAKNSGDSK